MRKSRVFINFFVRFPRAYGGLSRIKKGESGAESEDCGKVGCAKRKHKMWWWQRRVHTQCGTWNNFPLGWSLELVLRESGDGESGRSALRGTSPHPIIASLPDRPLPARRGERGTRWGRIRMSLKVSPCDLAISSQSSSFSLPQLQRGGEKVATAG
jgi:hypothetical protein